MWKGVRSGRRVDLVPPPQGSKGSPRHRTSCLPDMRRGPVAPSCAGARVCVSVRGGGPACALCCARGPFGLGLGLGGGRARGPTGPGKRVPCPCAGRTGLGQREPSARVAPTQAPVSSGRFFTEQRVVPRVLASHQPQLSRQHAQACAHGPHHRPPWGPQCAQHTPRGDHRPNEDGQWRLEE